MKSQESQYAVIFVAHKSSITEEYKVMSALLNAEIEKAEGYMGQRHVGEHTTITISYWKDEESIRKWKMHREHLEAQRKGKEDWYDWYEVQICKVERAYAFDRTRGSIQA